jgi:release factor glutamine methyltransferase
MTILELIQKTTVFFEKKDVDEPRLQVELLLAHVLGVKRIQLYLQFERELSEKEMVPLREMVRRRAEREPLQYILGKTEFFGLEFKTDSRALIPRRETEHLVETALGFYPDKNIPLQAIDLGTGAGVLAVTLAIHLTQSRWVAADASAAALSLARENAAAHGLDGRVHWLESSWWSGIAESEKFDLIVSNPPYIKTADLAHLAPELRQHEPAAALDGGTDGFDGYRTILSKARDHANPGARLAMEIGFDQGPALRELLAAHGWKAESCIKDLQGHDRVIAASLG